MLIDKRKKGTAVQTIRYMMWLETHVTLTT